MTNETLVAVLALIGTCVGSLGGIVASARLTNHRIAQLEKKVEKHNTLVERMAVVENSVTSAHKRIDDILC